MKLSTLFRTNLHKFENERDPVIVKHLITRFIRPANTSRGARFYYVKSWNEQFGWLTRSDWLGRCYVIGVGSASNQRQDLRDQTEIRSAGTGCWCSNRSARSARRRQTETVPGSGAGSGYGNGAGISCGSGSSGALTLEILKKWSFMTN